MLANQYGRFDASGRTYSITDPRTPMPWVNVVSNGRYGFVVSQNGGGFSWLDDSQHNVLTRWEMDLVRDERGRFLYTADLDSGDVWSLAPAPCRPEYDEYRCDHTLGATTFTTVFRGIRAVWTLAVAPDDPVEIWSVRLVNVGPTPRRLRISSYVEWCCGVAPDAKREFHRLFLDTSHDESRRAVFAAKTMWDVPPRSEREHWNRPWPYSVAHAVVGGAFSRTLAMGDKREFLGRAGQPAAPAALKGAIAGPSGFGRGRDAIAALGGDLTVPAHGETELFFLLAADADRASVERLIDRYSAPGTAPDAIAAATARWEHLLSATAVETEAQDFDALNNYWLPYQAISGRLWGRTGYYQQSGAFGFRDQLQDSQVWLPLEPVRCRKQILLHAAQQFADGSVYHWWHPLADFGLRTACSDDYLWLPFVASNYLKETGDFPLLQVTAPFVDNAAGASILDHCLRAFDRAFGRFNPRGLPLIGSCDWNDGLSAVGTEDRGESVWLAFFLIGLLADWAHILRHTGDSERAEDFERRLRELVAAVNMHAWDGEWFRRATLDSGKWIGSRQNAEGQIFLNAQTWAVLSDAADEARLSSAWRAVTARLLSDFGPLLLTPAYTEPDADIGYITRYAPGARENGGVYMHAATWALAAACKRRDIAAAQKIWRSISPPRRCEDPETYWAEPYVMPGNVDGPLSDRPGRAGWTWYTGSAAWLNRVSLEWVLGIRPTWEGLLIDPMPLPELGQVQAIRTWRGHRVRVRFDARDAAAGARPTLKVNGGAFAGNVLTESALRGAAAVEVEVLWESGTPEAARRTAIAGQEQTR